MSSNSNPRDDSRGSAAGGTPLCLTPNLSPATQPQPTPVKPATGTPSSPANSNATPRLLFTWNPYTTLNPTAGGPKPPEEEGGEEGRLASSIGGCSTTSSVTNVHNGGHGALAEGAGTANTSNSGHRSNAGGANSAAAAGAAAAAVAAAATPNPPGAARRPLTISALLAGAGGVSRGSPHLSAGAPMLSPKQSHAMMHQSPLSDTGGGVSSGPAAPHAPGSAVSTPSGPVLKRIPTTTRDGRQYFLDYSPTTSSGTFAQAVGAGTPSGAAATTVVVAAMPNLMLPPNTSPSLVVTPTQHRDPQLSPPGMEILDLDGGNNANTHNIADAATTPPEVAPLMSPPRSGGIGMHQLHPHHPGSYPSYATAGGSSSTGGGGLVMGMGSGGGSAGAAQHNPYRTSPTFYSSVTPPPGVAVPGAMGHVARAPPSQQQQQQHQDVEESDADLVFTLEAEPSVFITRLLPPPPPLPELARVLTVPGVVQSLCVRWCTYVAAVLRSSEFAAVTAAPPPPPSAVALMPRETPSPTPAATTSGSTTKEELAAWYETALRWWEALEQEGAKTVDVRVKSRAVSAAVEAVASGRASRVPMNGGAGRYGGGGGNNAQRGGGGAGGQGFRGRGGRGGAYNSYGAAGNATMGGGRGGGAAGPHGRGAAAPVERGSRGYGGAHYYASAPPALPVGVESHQVIPDEVDPRARCNTAFYASGAPSAAANTATAVQPSTSSNFNPYAESWHFSGDTGLANTAYGKGGPSTGPTAQQQQQQRYNSMNA